MYSVHWLLYILSNKPQVGFHVKILCHVCKHWQEWFSCDIVICISWRSLSCPPLIQWEGMLHVYRASFSFFNSLVTERSMLHQSLDIRHYISVIIPQWLYLLDRRVFHYLPRDYLSDYSGNGKCCFFDRCADSNRKYLLSVCLFKPEPVRYVIASFPAV